MNKFLSELASFARSHLGDDIYLIAPTLRVGSQWIDGALKTGGSFVNLRVSTLLPLALRIISPLMAAKNITMLKKTEAELIIASSWGQSKSGDEEYLKKLPRRASLFAALTRSLTELRECGIFEDINNDALEVRTKAKELNALHEVYKKELSEHKLIDRALAFKMASDAILSGEASFPVEAHLLIRNDTEFTAVEAEFIAALGEQVHPLNVDIPHTRRRPEGLFWAENEEAEVRHILREAMESARSLDSIEIVHTDYQTYVPIIYELLLERFGADNIPASFAEGLPARYSRPARALMAYAEIAGGKLQAMNIVRVINEGLLKFDIDFDREKLPALASSFRRLKPRGNLSQILECVNTELERVKIIDFKKDETTERVLLLSILSDTLGRINDLCPQNINGEDTPSYTDILESGIQFLEQFSYTSGELDEFAKEHLIGIIKEQIDAQIRFGGEINTEPRAAIDYMRELPQQATARVLGSSPRSGCLHVSGIDGGGYSSRPQVYFVGMDEGRIGNTARLDPILLDDERENISDKLPISTSWSKQRMARIWQLLAFQPNAYYVSYAANFGDDENSPSSIFLELARAYHSNDELEISDLPRLLGAPEGRMPHEPTRACDMNEWWAWAVDEKIENAHEFLFELYPHMKDAAHTKEMREDFDFTEYDGYVPECGRHLNPSGKNSKQVLSSRKLETMGACPRRYFLRYGLGIYEHDNLELDENIWLDALNFGSFLHSLFRIFISELVKRNERVNFDAHISEFTKLVDTELTKLAAILPPPSEAAKDKTQRDIMNAVHIFLHEEEKLQKTYEPIYLEASLGMMSETEQTDIDTLKPITLKLLDRKKMQVRGRIDRIDRISENEYSIWDYKSGKNRFDPNNPYKQGRMVQHALYIDMLFEVLKLNFGKGQKVRSFGYFYASERGEGERVTIELEQLANRREVFHLLCMGIERGEFIGTTDPNDCDYCDYRNICGLDKNGAELNIKKIQHSEEDEFIGIKHLRGLVVESE